MKFTREILNISAAILIILTFVNWTSSFAQSECDCDHTIPAGSRFIYGEDYDVKPGDVICLEAGEYESLEMFDFAGDENNRIKITNCGGVAVLARLRLENSQFFRLTGTEVSDSKYGIFIDGSIHDRTDGLSISIFSTDFEVDHLEFANTKAAAFHMVMRPECDPMTQRGNFTMRNIDVHDNYVHDIGTEGFYLGHTSYFGTDIECNNETIEVFPILLENVKIHGNTFRNTGWDAIQVSSAEALPGVQIYDNKIFNHGTENIATQAAGIVIGGGSSGRIYNNWIENPGDGTGTGGIHVFGIGEVYIYNNVIKGSGGVGVLVGNRSDRPDYGMYVINNNILDVAETGIRANLGVTTNNNFSNNIIINPGDYERLSNKAKAFISFPPDWDVDTTSNYTSPNYEKIGFENHINNNFYLTESSPATYAGADMSDFGITFDYNNYKRSSEKGFSIGAFEYGSEPSVVTSTDLDEYVDKGIDFRVFPNPLIGNNLSLFFKLEKADKIEIGLTSLSGKLSVTIAEKYFLAGSHNLTFSMDNLGMEGLSKGLYIVSIKGTHQLANKILVINR